MHGGPYETTEQVMGYLLPAKAQEAGMEAARQWWPGYSVLRVDVVCSAILDRLSPGRPLGQGCSWRQSEV